MVAVVAAVARNGAIGSGGEIPWDIPADKKYFKKLTLGNVLVMGRKTFESIGFALPGRATVVVSKAKTFSEKNLFTANSFDSAFGLAQKLAASDLCFGAESCLGERREIYSKKQKDIFFAGGAEVYRRALKQPALCGKIFLTEIYAEFEGDVFFPRFDKSLYNRKLTAHFAATNTTPAFEFVEYTKHDFWA